MELAKEVAQKIHAMRRLQERFNIKITHEYYLNLVKRIQANTETFLCRESNRRTLWKVRVHGVEMVAVYDTKHKTVATFLTLAMYEGMQQWREVNKEYQATRGLLGSGSVDAV